MCVGLYLFDAKKAMNPYRSTTLYGIKMVRGTYYDGSTAEKNIKFYRVEKRGGIWIGDAGVGGDGSNPFYTPDINIAQEHMEQLNMSMGPQCVYKVEEFK